MRSLLLSLGVVMVVPLAAGCTGLALGENDPDNNLGTDLVGGDIAVDPKTETTYVLASKYEGPAAAADRMLNAVRAGETKAEQLLDLTRRHDPRLLFVSNGVFVMSELDHHEHFDLFDPATLKVTAQAGADAVYWGTRQSASRRYIGVADNLHPKLPINVIDSETMSVHVMPHGGDRLEVMFANTTDRLFAISVDSATHHGRLLGWDMARLDSQLYIETPDHVWDGASTDVELDDVLFDDAFSFTWIGISPDDSKVVVPLIKWHPGLELGKATDDDFELVVLDTKTNTTNVVAGAKGPVGFTPDGATIVSYDSDRLLLINADTLVPDVEKVPIDKGEINFFVTHAGNDVLVASNSAANSLVLVDAVTKAQTKLAGPKLALGADEFVSRAQHDQLWTVDDKKLYKVDLQSADIDAETLDFTPGHIGILPKRDELVIGSDHTAKLHFVDPDTMGDLRTVDLSTE